MAQEGWGTVESDTKLKSDKSHSSGNQVDGLPPVVNTEAVWASWDFQGGAAIGKIGYVFAESFCTFDLHRPNFLKIWIYVVFRVDLAECFRQLTRLNWESIWFHACQKCNFRVCGQVMAQEGWEIVESDVKLKSDKKNASFLRVTRAGTRLAVHRSPSGFWHFRLTFCIFYKHLSLKIL